MQCCTCLGALLLVSASKAFLTGSRVLPDVVRRLSGEPRGVPVLVLQGAANTGKSTLIDMTLSFLGQDKGLMFILTGYDSDRRSAQDRVVAERGS